jgi:hypothetical protein
MEIIKYHKINSIFKRDMEKKGCPFIIGAWARPELEYLANNAWVWDEKIDGTNIRIWFDGEKVVFGGRTDRAQIPTHLLQVLQERYTVETLKTVFPNVTQEAPVTLFGEGCGYKIQKGGGNYFSDTASFVLFDVYIDGWWLLKPDVAGIGEGLDTTVAPTIGEGTIAEAIEFVKAGFNSQWGDFQAEGLVLRPKCPMFSRNGSRIITKVKYRDFK